MAALTVSRAQLDKAHEKVTALQSRVRNIRNQAEQTTMRVVRSIEVTGAAFGAGVLQGTGGIEVMGVPLELLGGGLLNLGGYLGVAGNASEHLVNVGDGLLAGYASAVGRGVGAELAADDKDKEEKVKGVGGSPRRGLASASDEEIVAAAREILARQQVG